MSDLTSDATAYPYPILTRLHQAGGSPNRQSILRTTQELTANAASIDSAYGDHGHAFLVMTPTNYQALNGGNAFVPPVAPGPNPIIAAGATAAAIAEAVRQHEGHLKAYRLMRHVQAKLRKMLLDSSDDLYWSLLRHEELLYSNRTVRELLSHMETVYGDFTDTERNEINSRMKVPWEGGPFEIVITQIQAASAALGLAGPGSALTDTQKRDALYDLVNESNLLEQACSVWRMKAAADKTWTTACAHFSAYAKDRTQTQTSGNTGFQANQMVLTALAANAEELGNLQFEMANLGTTHTTQAATILQLTTQLAAARATHQAYRDTVNQRTRTQPGNDRNRDRNLRNQPGNGDPRPRTDPGDRQYCWSHGWCAHNGPACRSPKTGHQTAATLENRMGGSDARCPA
jgi:hypothetical protein